MLFISRDDKNNIIPFSLSVKEASHDSSLQSKENDEKILYIRQGKMIEDKLIGLGRKIRLL